MSVHKVIEFIVKDDAKGFETELTKLNINNGNPYIGIILTTLTYKDDLKM